MSAPLRTRLSVVAAALSGALVVAMAGSALGTEHLGCSDFDTQEEAQAILGGVVCESLPSRGSADGPEESDEDAAPATTPATAPDGDEESGDEESGDEESGDEADGDRDCPDFVTQAAAQVAHAARPGDRERLDADGDGVACEQHFGTEGRQVAVFPQGGVATGGEH